MAECMTLLDNDISSALKDCATLPYWPDLNDTRRRALCNMRFELGFEGLLSFATFLDLMRQGRYKEAGEDLRGTKWAKQVPARANRVIRMIIEG